MTACIPGLNFKATALAPCTSCRGLHGHFAPCRRKVRGPRPRGPRLHGSDDAARPHAPNSAVTAKRTKPQRPSLSESSQARPNRPSPPRDHGPNLRLGRTRREVRPLRRVNLAATPPLSGAMMAAPSMRRQRSFRPSVPSDSPESPRAAAASPPPHARLDTPVSGPVLPPRRGPTVPHPRFRRDPCASRQRGTAAAPAAAAARSAPSPPQTTGPPAPSPHAFRPWRPPPKAQCRRCQ